MQPDPARKPASKIDARIGLADACEKLGVEKSFLLHCIELHWINPIEAEAPLLDDEDLARARLILELRQDFGVNDNAIPVILHLLDQLYFLRSKLV